MGCNGQGERASPRAPTPTNHPRRLAFAMPGLPSLLVAPKATNSISRRRASDVAASFQREHSLLPGEACIKRTAPHPAGGTQSAKLSGVRGQRPRSYARLKADAAMHRNGKIKKTQRTAQWGAV